MKVFIVVVVGAAVLGVVVGGWWLIGRRAEPTVTVGGHQFIVKIARTEAQQERGLGGVRHLDPSDGMYFPLDQTKPAPSFWMKGMVISIDIIWIKDEKVVGITANIPAKPGVPDEQLPVYSPPQVVLDGVLEIAGGRSASLGLKVGMPAVFVE